MKALTTRPESSYNKIAGMPLGRPRYETRNLIEDTPMKKAVVYIHGKGGSAGEAAHYQPLFAGDAVIGFDYAAQFPWQAKEEFPRFFAPICREYASVTVVANSIGAFFAMQALGGLRIGKALFISPIVDMEKLIADMMAWAGVTEEELRAKGEIETGFGETLSWKYLCYVRENPAVWAAPTHILYGGKDHLTSYKTISEFAARHAATLTVMEEGEHWFHTEEQMRFLDRWAERYG